MLRQEPRLTGVLAVGADLPRPPSTAAPGAGVGWKARPKGHLWGLPSQKESEGGGRLGPRPPSTGRPEGGLAWPRELGAWVRVDSLARWSHSQPTDSWWAADKERQLSESQLATDKTDKHLQWPEEGGGGCPHLGWKH